MAGAGGVESELVCFLDADTEDFSAHFATGLLGPLVCEPQVVFVKAFYRRPMEGSADPAGEGGGRVNHLTAQAGAGAVLSRSWRACASRSPARWRPAASCSRAFPFVTGYGVEIAMLIDVWRAVGLTGSPRWISTSTATPTSPCRL